MNPITRTLTLTLLFVASLIAFAADAPDADLQARYNQQWGAREQTAKDTEGRIALAKDLYEAADRERDKPMKLMLADAAYQWGNRDCPQGYYYAAKGLLIIRKIDPSRKVECLERLAFLFNTAWSRDRSKFLKNGAEFADVKVQIAQQRWLDAVAARQTEAMSKPQFTTQLNQVKRDYAEAYGAARAVIGTADRYAKTHPSEEARKMLAQFVDENQPLLKRIDEGRSEFNDFIADYIKHGDAALPEPAGGAKVAVANPPADAPPRTQPEAPKEPPVAVAEPREEPPVAVAPPADAPQPVATGPVRTSRGMMHMIKCDKCGEMFMPPPGSDDKICYWCKNELGFFRVDGK
ncbi:MAG: hypothetical protein GC162_16235 [Planctomycetes bacterium]|nr:hypothetical protein [Planctomycetota bacterium]